MVSEILQRPTWSWLGHFFVRPFVKEGGPMYRQNGNPHDRDSLPDRQDPRGYPEGFAFAYQNRRISVRDLDLTTLLKGIRDAVIIVGSVFSWLIPTFRPPQPMPNVDDLKAAFSQALTEAFESKDVADTEKPDKATPMKGTAKGKPRSVPNVPKKDKSSFLTDDGLKATEPYMAYPSIRGVSLSDKR